MPRRKPFGRHLRVGSRAAIVETVGPSPYQIHGKEGRFLLKVRMHRGVWTRERMRQALTMFVKQETGIEARIIKEEAPPHVIDGVYIAVVPPLGEDNGPS